MERGQRIKVLRVAKGWRQPDLAAAVRSAGSFESASYLSKIESGRAGAVSIGTFEAIATALEVPSDVILTDRFDEEIRRDPIRFVRRHSLEKTTAKHHVGADEAAALRAVERAVKSGPVTVAEWEILRAYALAYREKVRKPGARAESRRRRQPRPAEAPKVLTRTAKP